MKNTRHLSKTDISDFKFECVKMFLSFVSTVQISDENSRLWSILSGRVTKISPASPPLSNDLEQRDIGNSMSVKNLILGVNSVSLLQFITKCYRYYYKMRQLFYYKIWQRFRFFITKCNNLITKCDSYYKLRQFHYKMWQLFQNAIFITNCDNTKSTFIMIPFSK